MMTSFRKTFLPLGFAILSVAACTKDQADNVTSANSDATQQGIDSENFWAAYFKDNLDQEGALMSYTSRITVPRNEVIHTPALRLTSEMSKHLDTLSWEYMHDFTQMYLEYDGIDPDVVDARYSAALTVVGLEIAHRKAMEAHKTPRRDSVMEYWMDIVVAHSGADTEAMAELALALKPIVSEEKYNSYRDYIVERSQADLAELTPRLKAAQDRVRQGDVDSLNNSVFLNEIAFSGREYLKAKQSLRLLNAVR